MHDLGKKIPTTQTRKMSERKGAEMMGGKAATANAVRGCDQSRVVLSSCLFLFFLFWKALYSQQ
jgi:hypothetical protein